MGSNVSPVSFVIEKNSLPFRELVVDAVRHLDQHMDEKTPLDEALSAFRSMRGWRGYWIEPNLVQHIGFQSSLGAGQLHAAARDGGDLREYHADYAI